MTRRKSRYIASISPLSNVFKKIILHLQYHNIGHAKKETNFMTFAEVV